MFYSPFIVGRYYALYQAKNRSNLSVFRAFVLLVYPLNVNRFSICCLLFLLSLVSSLLLSLTLCLPLCPNSSRWLLCEKRREL